MSNKYSYDDDFDSYDPIDMNNFNDLNYEEDSEQGYTNMRNQIFDEYGYETNINFIEKERNIDFVDKETKIDFNEKERIEDEGAPKYWCPFCDQKFSDIIYDHHIQYKCYKSPFSHPLPKITTPYKCHDCDKFFPTDAHLIEHLNFYCFDDEYIPYYEQFIAY